MAVIGLIGLLAPSGIAEFLVMAPVAACLVRWLATWRAMADALCQPVALAILATGVWGVLALAWTSDLARGLDELSSYRHALLVVALWPLRDHRGPLIGALAIGFALGHVSQVGHAIGVWGDVAWLRWPRLADRNSGWWNPVVGGTLLCGAIGLHLPAAMWGSGSSRWIGLGGLCAAIAGVVATGTRGAWIAAAGLIGLAVVVAAWRAIRGQGGKRERRAVLAVLGLGMVAVGLAVVVAGPAVMGRAERGVEEVERVMRERDYASDTGRRLFMWIESLEALRHHPIGGLGTGGLVDEATLEAVQIGLDPSLVLDHAHGMWVHVGATQGIVGLGCWLAVVVAGLWSAWRWRCRVRFVRWRRLGNEARGASQRALVVGIQGDPRAARLVAQLETSYALAPAWALLGLVSASAFDTVQVNSQTAMLLFAVLALCAMGRRGRHGSDRWRGSGSAEPCRQANGV